jgi:ABC-type polysaccharide transport system permease subunit
MQLSNKVKVFSHVFTNNDGHRIAQQILLVVVQRLCFKLPVCLKLSAVFTQEIKKTFVDRQVSTQQHNWCLRTKTVSLPLREKKP